MREQRCSDAAYATPHTQLVPWLSHGVSTGRLLLESDFNERIGEAIESGHGGQRQGANVEVCEVQRKLCICIRY